MDTNDQMVTILNTTTAAIDSYCRVVELQVKLVEQGANPEAKGPLGEAVQMAMQGIRKEVEFLSFLRERGFQGS